MSANWDSQVSYNIVASFFQRSYNAGTKSCLGTFLLRKEKFLILLLMWYKDLGLTLLDTFWIKKRRLELEYEEVLLQEKSCGFKKSRSR